MQKLIVLFLFYSFSFTTHSMNDIDNKNLSTLFNEVVPAHDSCVTPIMHAKTAPLPSPPAECLSAFFDGALGKSVIENLPKRLRDWGSNGRAGLAWHFDNSACDDFFAALFFHIADVMPKVVLSPHDLFHGHLIRSYAEKSRPNYFAIVFHAKEYPSDMEEIKNNYQIPTESFSSQNPTFSERNFIYISAGLSSETGIYMIKNQGACADLFVDRKSYTLSETKVAKSLIHGKIIGDVNFFLTQNIGRIKYQFFPGIHDVTGDFVDDFEAHLTNKSFMKRTVSNLILDDFIAKQAGRPIIYFLTGHGAS